MSLLKMRDVWLESHIIQLRKGTTVPSGPPILLSQSWKSAQQDFTNVTITLSLAILKIFK